MNLKHYFQKNFLIPLILWITFSLRVYSSDLVKTILETGKIFIGSGLYALGMTIIANGLTAKIARKRFSRDYFIKTVLWLAVITAIAASFEFYFGMNR